MSASGLRPEMELMTIYRLIEAGKSKCREGDTFFIICMSWWQKWVQYTSGILNDHVNSSSPPTPGPITNGPLVCSDAYDEPELKNNKIHGKDYIMVDSEIWALLYKWYSGSPILEKKAINSAVTKGSFVVEIFPVYLYLMSASNVREGMIKISKKETVHNLKRKACEILGLTGKEVSLFKYYNGEKHEIIDRSNTIHESGIETNDNIMVEIRDRQNMFATHIAYPNHAMMFKESTMFAGLKQFEACSYVNSVIQCLAYSSELAEFLINLKDAQLVGKEESAQELLLEFRNLVRLLRQSNGVASYSPSKLMSKIEQVQPFLIEIMRHDVQKFLSVLLEGLHFGLHCMDSPLYSEGAVDEQLQGCDHEEIADKWWQCHIKKNHTIITDLFEGQLKLTMGCFGCRKVSFEFHPFKYLSLPLHNTKNSAPSSLYTCLETFLQVSSEKDKEWICPQCQNLCGSQKKFDIIRLPNVLIIHLKRTFDDSKDNYVPLRTEMDLTDFVIQKEGRRHVYELYATCNHRVFMTKGMTQHYDTANIKVLYDYDSSWLEFHDEKVRNILHATSGTTEYLLFYQRKISI